MARVATTIGVLVASALCLVLPGSTAGADARARLDEPFEITADRIDYDAVRELYTAHGRVRVAQGERRLSARWLAFSTATRVGVAEGDVVVLDGPDELQAAFMIFDVDTLQGTLFQGVVDAGSAGFRVEAEELVRTGPNEFELRDGLFTTCRCENEDARLPWQIRTGRGQVELGRYGTVTNSTFEVLGVPVLWIPWAFFPVKSERETGLLMPEFSFGGRGGEGFGLPFFWAALPELNVIATPRYFTERGYKQDLELEYVFSERSGGELFVAGLVDRSAESRKPYPRERWAVLWQHDQELPAAWRWKTDLKLSSDNLYSDDFDELWDYRAFRFMESTTNVARDFGESGGFGTMVGARYADDLQGSTFDDRDELILQRFAELRGDALPGAVRGPLGVELRMDSELIHFSALRSIESELEGLAPGPLSPTTTDGRFYDIGLRLGQTGGPGDGDGILQPGEPLAEKGTRIVVHPRLARPFRVGRMFEVVPEVGWQQAFYESSDQKFAERGLLTARLDLRGRLARDFQGRDGRVLHHVLEPSVGWALVSSRRQRDNPIFVPRALVPQTRVRTLALQNVTRDPSDRIESANRVVLGLGQRFYSRAGRNRPPRLRADLTTAIDWDFAGGDGLGHFILDGRVFPIGPVSTRVRTVFDPEVPAFEEVGTELTLRAPIDNGIVQRPTLIGGYRYLRRLPLFFESARGDPSSARTGDTELNQVDLTARIELFERLRLSYSTVYSLAANGGFIRNRGMLEYVSRCRCWGMGFAVAQERRQGFRFGVSIRVLGLGDDSSDLFGGGLGAGLNL